VWLQSQVTIQSFNKFGSLKLLTPLDGKKPVAVWKDRFQEMGIDDKENQGAQLSIHKQTHKQHHTFGKKHLELVTRSNAQLTCQNG
jgi:hypothetical protein